MPTSQRRRSKDRKEAIAVVAAELFCARGYHNVGIEDIAEEVGITGPAIYRHFSTKQAVLAAAVQELVTHFVECVRSGAHMDAPHDRLHAALRALVRYTLDRRTMARLYQWEGRYLPAEQRAVVAASFDGAVRTLRELLLDLRPELAKHDAALLTAAALSVIASPSTHRASLSRTKAERTILDCVTAVISADLPAAPRQRQWRHRPDQFTLLPRRERLLAEAIRLFHERGYHQVSISDIGQAAGINASSVYTHFASKAELLAAAYYRATSRLEHTVAATLADASTPVQALGRLIDAYVKITFDQADLAAVYLSESENLPPADLRRLRAAQRRHVDTWVGLVAEVCPEEEPSETRFRTHAALNIVADLARSANPSVTEERTAALLGQMLRLPDRGGLTPAQRRPPTK
ncbi:TetR/AcrR family transcriptional regulator [Microtetraspora sp. AC03309]|uniref:TetR/AcrR family transcriptional regulator n=1 Tax=Microtetraspora sp. AC03309 TaxID=2779376 RepID=UPI001E3E8D09|nr:TetR/AcrR family transcriptional regulator [Microtetraspora sp. AC03309]MCC5574400.1 TetR/AcrR family transcriptional regulator [Microtetraspora sp. AC03309]